MVDFAQKPNTRAESKAISSELEQSRAAGGLSRPMTRRNFIVWYLAGLLTATVVAIAMPLLVFIYPPEGSTKKKELPVTLQTPIDKIANGDAVKLEAPKDTGFVMTTGGGDNAPGKIAFAAYAVKDTAGKLSVLAVNCSHLGCSVSLSAADKLFKCPCHGSEFRLNGDVAHGPAAYPLSLLGWKQGPNPTQILVQGIQLGGII
jgi:Rieske Fe-S protein